MRHREVGYVSMLGKFTVQARDALMTKVGEFSRLLSRCRPSVVGDRRLTKSLPIHLGGRELFRVLDFGPVSRMRADTFSSKEPETLRWIDSFERGSTFLDVGANIGLYSLYACFRDLHVVAVEPDALNFALLHSNIRLNDRLTRNRVRGYPIALHHGFHISDLNISSVSWGAALSSFDNTTDFKGDSFTPLFSQGAVGTSLDDLVSRIGFEPRHIKIDVDGNEGHVLAGASETLRKSYLRSVLVELDERRVDYQNCLEIISNAGLRLVEKSHAEMFSQSNFAKSFNHIFVR